MFVFAYTINLLFDIIDLLVCNIDIVYYGFDMDINSNGNKRSITPYDTLWVFTLCAVHAFTNCILNYRIK